MTTTPAPYPAASLAMDGKVCIVTGAASGIGRAIARQLAANGARVVIDASCESHFGIQKNFAFALVDEATLDRQVADVVAAGAQAVATYCTNLYAAHRVAHWEQQHGVPVFDTVTTVVWDMLRRLGVDTRRIDGWGRLLQEI